MIALRTTSLLPHDELIFDEFEAAAQCSLEQRMRYGFLRATF
jgi:hypothetical protein